MKTYKFFIGVVLIITSTILLIYPPKEFKPISIIKFERSAEVEVETCSLNCTNNISELMNKPYYNDFMKYHLIKRELKKIVDESKTPEFLSNGSRENSESNTNYRLVELTPPTRSGIRLIALDIVRKNKPGILVMGGFHSLAWTTPLVLLKLAKILISNYECPQNCHENFSWYLIPTANPDGLNKMLSLREPCDVKRMVKPKENKARRIMDYCLGLNIDKNFGVHYLDLCPNWDKCCNIHINDTPLITKESRAINNYIENRTANIDVVFQLEAEFGDDMEYIGYPWRFTEDHIKNKDVIDRKMKNTIKTLTELFPDSNITEIQMSKLSKQTGSFMDYMYGVKRANFVYLTKFFHETMPHCGSQPKDDFIRKNILSIFNLIGI